MIQGPYAIAFDTGKGMPCEWCGSRSQPNTSYPMKFHFALPFRLRNIILRCLIDAYLESDFGIAALERLESFLRHRWKLDDSSERLRRRYLRHARDLRAKGYAELEITVRLHDLAREMIETANLTFLTAEDPITIYEDEYCLQCEERLPAALLAYACELRLTRPPYCSYKCSIRASRQKRRGQEWTTFADPFLWLYVEPPTISEKRHWMAVLNESPL